MSKKFLALKVVAEIGDLTLAEREALEKRILQILGCDGTEANCPIVLHASTVVDDAQTACNWLR